MWFLAVLLFVSSPAKSEELDQIPLSRAQRELIDRKTQEYCRPVRRIPVPERSTVVSCNSNVKGYVEFTADWVENLRGQGKEPQMACRALYKTAMTLDMKHQSALEFCNKSGFQSQLQRLTEILATGGREILGRDDDARRNYREARSHLEACIRKIKAVEGKAKWYRLPHQRGLVSVGDAMRFTNQITTSFWPYIERHGDSNVCMSEVRRAKTSLESMRESYIGIGDKLKQVETKGAADAASFEATLASLPNY